MHKLIFLLTTLLLVNVYASPEQQAQKDPNIVVIQAPDKVEYKSDNDGLKCTTENFYCPEIKFKKINKSTNQVLDSWYLRYDMKNISDINYRNGKYTCQYSFNDVIEYKQTFTNPSCQKELKTQKEKMINGENLFGFDYQKLNNDINNIDIKFAKSVDEIAEEIGVITDIDEYETKGFHTFSNALNKILTFDEEFIKGTDSQMNLVLKNNYDSNDNTQSYYTNSNEVYTIADDSGFTRIDADVDNNDKLFGKSNYDALSTVLNYLGVTDSYETRKEDILSSYSNAKDLLNTQNFGYYINWLFINKDELYYGLMTIIIVLMIKKGTLGGIDRLKEIYSLHKKNKYTKSDYLTTVFILAIGSFIFFFPMNERKIQINGVEHRYSTTIAQDTVVIFISKATEIADISTNKNTINTANYLNKVSNIYTKDELKLFTDNIALDLIVSKRQNDFLKQQCAMAYGSIDGTFIKSSMNSFHPNANYDLFNNGVPSPSVCKNTESNMFLNLKSIDENSKLLDYKINQKNEDLNKNLNILNAKLLLTTNEFGWIVSPLMFTVPLVYEDLATNLEVEKKEKIDNFISNYFKDPEIKSINDTLSSDVLGYAQSGISVIAKYGFMHWIPTFSTIQKEIKNELSFGNNKSNSIEPDDKTNKQKSKAKNKIINWIGSKSKSLVSKLSTTISTLVSASSTIASYMLATIVVISAIKYIKVGIVLGIIAYKMFGYLREVILVYYFNIIIVIRMIINRKEENVIYLSMEFIYILLYPLFLVLAISLLKFIDGLAQQIINLILNFQLESMRLTSYVATMSQGDAIDTFTTGAEAILKIGMYEGMYQIIALIIISIIAYETIVDIPNKLFKFIGSIDKRDATDKLENKADKTGV